MGDVCISGALTGELYVWTGNSLTQSIKGLHTKPMDSIEVTPNYVLTGGKDLVVNVLKFGSLEKQFAFSVNE